MLILTNFQNNFLGIIFLVFVNMLTLITSLVRYYKGRKIINKIIKGTNLGGGGMVPIRNCVGPNLKAYFWQTL